MTSLKLLSLAIGSTLFLGACTGQTQNSTSETGDQTQPESQMESGDAMMEGESPDDAMMEGKEGAMEAEMATYTLTEVAEHNSPPDDCWIVIDGTVYDVSGFAEAGHGGGEAVYQGCGIDATQLFETRPMGSGTPHSEKARGFLPNFAIGKLAAE